MKNNLQLFIRSLILSASTVGGGYVIIAALQRIYVEQLKLISEEDMLDIASLAQSSPGAAAVNASVLIGLKLGGTMGAAASLAGTIIPPLFIMILISSLYDMCSRIQFLSDLMLGMRAGVAAVILHTAFIMTFRNLRDRSLLKKLLFGTALVLLTFSDISCAFIILAAILIASVSSVFSSIRRTNHAD